MEEEEEAEEEEPCTEICFSLTRREAELLSVAACELFHRMRETESHEIYGALIVNETVLISRSLWNKVDDVIGIRELSE